LRIKVRGYLSLRGVLEDQPFREIEAESITVRELISQVSLELEDEFPQATARSRDDGVGRHILVLVNGRHCSHLPDGLDTELRDGDQVALFPPVAGG
jgi:molybdopterin synthase sulfur carrier subunit